MSDFHAHREAAASDFQGKTVLKFEPSADNIWRFWFTDGTSFAVQCECESDGIPYMEICDQCA